MALSDLHLSTGLQCFHGKHEGSRTRRPAKFVEELFPEARDIRLEEIVANGPKWNVVVSFQTAGSYPLSELMKMPRIFKQVEVERDSGETRCLTSLAGVSSYTTGLIDRYRGKGILVDTTLLLLYVVGSYKPSILDARDIRPACSLLLGGFRDALQFSVLFSRSGSRLLTFSLK